MRARRSSEQSPKLTAAIALAILMLGGCVGPPILERQVLGYDEVTAELDQKLLLLNIARVDSGRPVHFTTTSSIAATFDWTTTIGVGGRLEESQGTNFLDLNLGASASENPTFSIIPISGEEFTKRVLTPFTDDVFEFLVFQSGAIDGGLRLMAAGIEVQDAIGAFVRFIENDPAKPAEYEEFRRLALHLRWLADERQLFVRSLVFEETLIEEFQAVPRAEDINNGFNLGLRWRQKPDGNYELTRFQAGRVVVTNYDPMALSDRERFELNERIKRNPKGFVHLQLRPDRPGGDPPIQGAIKLRSILQMLQFIGRGISVSPEFDVAPDLRTGPVAENPRSTLEIDVSGSAPTRSAGAVRYEGRHYSVADSDWDRRTFAALGYLFQSAVGEIEDVGIPITIAK